VVSTTGLSFRFICLREWSIKFHRWGTFALHSSLYWFKLSVLSSLPCYAALSPHRGTGQGSVPYCATEGCAVTPLTEGQNLLLPNWEFKLFPWWVFIDVFYMCFLLIYFKVKMEGKEIAIYLSHWRCKVRIVCTFI